MFGAIMVSNYGEHLMRPTGPNMHLSWFEVEKLTWQNSATTALVLKHDFT